MRDAKHTNFVEFRNYKIIYRRYAGLYFCICVDVADNNLFYLEAIASGLPVIGGRNGGVPDIVLDGETGILAPPEDSAGRSLRRQYRRPAPPPPGSSGYPAS